MATNPFISKESLGEVAEWVMNNPPPTAFFGIYGESSKDFSLRGVYGYYGGNTTIGDFLSYPGGFWPKTLISRYLTNGPTTSYWTGLYLFTPIDFSINHYKEPERTCFRATPVEVTENSKTTTNISHTLRFCAYNVGINKSNVFIDMDVIHSRTSTLLVWGSKIQNVSLAYSIPGDSSYTYSDFTAHVI